MFGFERTEYDKKVYDEQLADFLPATFIDIHTHIWKKNLTGRITPRAAFPGQSLSPKTVPPKTFFRRTETSSPAKKSFPC